MKSIITTTTISSEVPPKLKRHALRRHQDLRHQADRGHVDRAPQRQPRQHLVDVLGRLLPRTDARMKAPDFFRLSAVSRELNTSAV